MAKTNKPAKNSALLKALDGFGVINLRSYYPNGKGIETPVDFIVLEGKVYVRTGSHSYKMKRIRANPHIRIFPSDMRGQAKGPEIEARARILDSANEAPLIKEVEVAFSKRYGMMGKVLAFIERRRETSRSVLEIEAR